MASLDMFPQDFIDYLIDQNGKAIAEVAMQSGWMDDYFKDVERTVNEAEQAMSANDKQVGGDHYKTGGIQPWDLWGPEFFVGNALKYVARWRKKNGVQDLEKAKHYLEKLLEQLHVNPEWLDLARHGVGEELALAWLRNAGLDWHEKTICLLLMDFETVDHIKLAKEGIEFLIDAEKVATTTDWPSATPLPPDQMQKRRVPRYFKPDPYIEVGERQVDENEILAKYPTDKDYSTEGNQ